ncbi:TonB family protein [Rhodanobacter sp. Root179]|uniref:energy transducer TonB n=1 Tax=unclassified Rhodanobacter TaxID=2621553 RepID=UPI0006FAED49|nr:MULTISPECIES: energy transducer TonB [unclassified Rhodanobacter]KRB39465.1 energy transducer TonB [Rhodanobacter sp. Root179]QRP64671.1 energy transducer TonB [Rhodanobacter sp. FDAARGOS 1247]
MSHTASVNSPPDPIGATFLFSLLLHGVLLLGITFHFVKPSPSLPTLDVTLVNVANRQAPDKADFLAQANNTGGGQSDRAARPSAPFSGAIPKPDPGIAAQPVDATTPQPREATPTRMVTTSSASDFQVTSDTARDQVDPQQLTPTAEELKRREAIAQLAAELRKKKVDYAKRPKVKYLTASTREYAYAAYMRGWSDRVERVGNLNYPEEARRQGLHGDVLLTVVLNLDGSIKTIEVIQSSGQKVLDAAAERIVRLAAPFPPAPKSAERIDQLNITRTWRFQPNNVLQTR